MKPVICLDLDGVLATYEGWYGHEHIGEPLSGAVEFTRQLARMAKVVIYTTRMKIFDGDNTDIRQLAELRGHVRSWLECHGFHYDEIYTGQGKPFACAYIDDRAIACKPQESHTPEFEYQFALAAAATAISKLQSSDVSELAARG
jgi:hypothetical protein